MLQETSLATSHIKEECAWIHNFFFLLFLNKGQKSNKHGWSYTKVRNVSLKSFLVVGRGIIHKYMTYRDERGFKDHIYPAAY